jgi:hypothetical protein
MRGRMHKAVGRIVESPSTPAGATGPTMGHGRETRYYTVEVVSPNGQPVRGSVGLTSLFIHAVGEPMAVQVNFRTGEMILDDQAEALLLREQATSMRTENALNRSDQPDPGTASGLASW